MLFASSIAAGDMPSFPTVAQGRVQGRLGWRCLGEERIKNGAPPDQQPFVANYMNDARLRWRGADAQGAGTRFANRHWSTAFASSKHVPIPFKANPAAGVTYPELESSTRGVMRGVLVGA